MLFQLLDDEHDRKNFDCGDQVLNRWLTQIAKQHKAKGISATYVAVPNESSNEIVGYYAVTLTEIVNSNLPAKLAKRLPDKSPAFLLGRLAVAIEHQGKGNARLLLFDAIDRLTLVSKQAGGIGIVVNAKNSAVDFYQRYGFEQLPDHRTNLFLPF